MIEINKSSATKFSTDPVPVYWHNLPEDIVSEIFSHIVPEELLGISGEPLSLIDRKICKELSKSHFWLKKFKRHFPLIFERMTEKQKNAISDWRQKFIETRKFVYALPEKTNSDGYFYYNRLASEIKENDLEGVKKTLSCFKSIKTAIGENFKITQLFLIDIVNPVFGGSVLQLARKSNRQDFLNEIYNALATCVKDYLSEKNDSLMLKSCIYWALHCKQPFQSILDMIQELEGFHEKAFIEIDYRADEYDRTMDLGLQPVHMAAQAGNVEFLEYLIDQNPELINVFSNSIPGKQTPLVYALMANEPEAAMWLIEKGADLKMCWRKKFPFHLAAANGMENILSKMLEKDPSLLDKSCNDHEYFEGWNALEFAIYNHQDDTALWLLDKGADCKRSFPGNYFGRVSMQSIHLASARGRLAVIKKMYEIDPTCLNAVCSGMTPLFCALWGQHWPVVKFMLLNGATVSYHESAPPFQMAIWKKNISIAILLLSHGAIRPSLPKINSPHHQFPWSWFSSLWGTKAQVEASKEFILVWDLLDYIEEHVSPNYVRPFNMLEIFSPKKSSKDELAAAEALRDIIYKNEAPESLKKEMQTIISEDPRLLAVFTWFKNEYYPKFNLDLMGKYSETAFVLENEITKPDRSPTTRTHNLSKNQFYFLPRARDDHNENVS